MNGARTPKGSKATSVGNGSNSNVGELGQQQVLLVKSVDSNTAHTQTMTFYWQLAEQAEAWATDEVKQGNGKKPGFRRMAKHFGIQQTRLRSAVQLLTAFRENGLGLDDLLHLEFPLEKRGRPNHADWPTFWMVAALCQPRWRKDLKMLLAKAVQEGWGEQKAKEYLKTVRPSRSVSRASPSGVAKKPGPGTKQRGASLIARLRRVTRTITDDLKNIIKASPDPLELEATFVRLESLLHGIEGFVVAAKKTEKPSI